MAFGRSVKLETIGGEKNKAPVASPLFWLFRQRLRPQILTDGGHVRRTNEKLKKRSINRQQHKLQEITTTRTWITFSNLRLSAAKIRFSQSKFSSCLTQRRERKEGRPVVQTNSKVTLHIITSLWVVFSLFPNPVGSNSRTSFLLLHFSKAHELWSLKAAFTISLFAAVNYDHKQRTLKQKHQTDRNPAITSHDLGRFPFSRNFRKFYPAKTSISPRSSPSRETSPAAKSEEKRMFSQATEISVRQ